jgi:hypothetical protein
MEQARRRPGDFQVRSGCAASSRRWRLSGSSHRHTGAARPGLVAHVYASLLMEIKLEMARALRQLLQAPDCREASGVVVRNPILLVESASELLRATLEEAERRGDRADRDMLLSYLHILELERRRAWPA